MIPVKSKTEAKVEEDLLPLLPKNQNEQNASKDWRWQMRESYTCLSDLQKKIELTKSEIEGIKRAEKEGLPIAITPYYLSLIDQNNPDCPIRKQCIPQLDEKTVHDSDLIDPLAEKAHEVTPHLVQRYPDRVLLLLTSRCSVYCRFCTRSRIVGRGFGVISPEALKEALFYISSHVNIRDVILSGGDPLAMNTHKLVHLIKEVRAIAHVETIRLATRTPVTLPMRITDELVSQLAPFHPLWIMTHFNHPKELSLEAKSACEKLANAGFPVMNQCVLLRRVNDNADTLETLFRALVRVRVRPYYLLQMDPVSGTSHLRTRLSDGLRLMDQLQGKLSGIAVPKFVCDTPGGKGKVALLHNNIVHQDIEKKTSTLRTFRGELVDYVDPY